MATPPVTRTGRRASGTTSAKAARGQINLRVKPDVLSLFDHAAKLTGKNRTDFVLDAASQAAQQTLLDQAHVQLDQKAFTAFLHLLEAPIQPNENLRKTLQTPAPWE